MKTKTKKITYRYCDFCNKRMVREDSMRHHEERCTLNPDRNCGMCEKKRDLKTLASIFGVTYKSKGKIESLRWLDHTVRCPACMLAILRLSNVASEFIDIFNFKEAMGKWNEEIANQDPRLCES